MNIKSKIVPFLLAGTVVVSLNSCGGNKTENKDSAKADTAKVVEEPKKKELAPGMTPFDFPTVPLKAEAGDNVLTPGFKMWQNTIAEEDPTNETYIFYTSKMKTAGAVESEIESTFDGVVKMPNSMIIAIPKGQTAKKGDVVLTWWQTGSGMQRAIVVNDKNPKEPVVIYLDLSYDNPAKDSKSGKSIGATEYQLAPDSFVKISEDWQEGNMIAAKDGDKWNSVQIVKVAGEKVLTIGFAGKMKVYAKADCKPVPIVPNVKVGDKVQAVFVGSFGEYTVKKVDAKIGRVFVEQFSSDKAIPYGQVAPTL